MNISDKAVEAAWDALRESRDHLRSPTRSDLEAALAAAAPHMLAGDRGDLWDEGNLAGKEASHRFERTNPYTRHARESSVDGSSAYGLS